MRRQVLGDASAALDIINRRGLRRTRHIDAGLLRTQEAAAAKRLESLKVLDLFMQHLPHEVCMGHYRRRNLEFREGRAGFVPKLNLSLTAISDYVFDGT